MVCTAQEAFLPNVNSKVLGQNHTHSHSHTVNCDAHARALMEALGACQRIARPAASGIS